MTVADSELARFKALRPHYKRPLERFFAAAKPGDPRVLRRGQFIDARDTLAQKFKPATVHVTISAARAFYDWLLDRETIKENPGYRVKVHVPDNVPIWNVLSSDREIAALLAAPDGVTAMRDRAVLACLCLQGWRATAFCLLIWGGVRNVGGGLGVGYAGKGGKQCFDRLEPGSLEAVRAYWGNAKPQASDPLVPVSIERRKPLSRQAVHSIVRRWANKIGSKATPHGLRATAVSQWIRDEGIEYARQRAHHSSIETTQRYSRWAPPERGKK